MTDNPTTRNRIVSALDKILTAIDDIILFLVALGIIGVAILLLSEAITDYINFTSHSTSHIISDLMFVLIIMELYRQVMRQINRHTFSLNPFIYIGVIASIRGILLTQMKLGMGETKWSGGVIQLIVHSLIVLILITGLYIYAKYQEKTEEQ
ncbi:MAG: phosphate-starvation-inducible PsiE family protein [Deltaproteobacteria bacterium]|nr:phosphate-starvation-inducible PsiE family protein [Deltaproteobacteria bacterium]